MQGRLRTRWDNLLKEDVRAHEDECGTKGTEYPNWTRCGSIKGRRKHDPNSQGKQRYVCPWGVFNPEEKRVRSDGEKR